MVRKSSAPRSASRARSAQYPAVNSSAGPRVGRAPGGGMPAGAVERDGEVQFAGFRHDRLLPAVRQPVTDANRVPAKPSNPIVNIAC